MSPIKLPSKKYVLRIHFLTMQGQIVISFRFCWRPYCSSVDLKSSFLSVEFTWNVSYEQIFYFMFGGEDYFWLISVTVIFFLNLSRQIYDITNFIKPSTTSSIYIVFSILIILKHKFIFLSFLMKQTVLDRKHFFF